VHIRLIYYVHSTHTKICLKSTHPGERFLDGNPNESSCLKICMHMCMYLCMYVICIERRCTAPFIYAKAHVECIVCFICKYFEAYMCNFHVRKCIIHIYVCDLYFYVCASTHIHAGVLTGTFHTCKGICIVHCMFYLQAWEVLPVALPKIFTYTSIPTNLHTLCGTGTHPIAPPSIIMYLQSLLRFFAVNVQFVRELDFWSCQSAPWSQKRGHEAQHK
jgi:hypothetical protein